MQEKHKPPRQTRTVPVLFLQDHYPTGFKCGDVVELDRIVAGGLIKQGICDNNPENVKAHQDGVV